MRNINWSSNTFPTVLKHSMLQRNYKGIITHITCLSVVGQHTSVGIGTVYKVDVPGFEWRWGRNFRIRLDHP